MHVNIKSNLQGKLAILSYGRAVNHPEKVKLFKL